MLYKLLNYVWSCVMFMNILLFPGSLLYFWISRSLYLCGSLRIRRQIHCFFHVKLFVYLGSVKSCPSRQWGLLVKVIKVPVFNAHVYVRSFLNAQLNKQGNTNKLTVSVSMVTNINNCCRIQLNPFYLFKLWVLPSQYIYTHTSIENVKNFNLFLK